MHTVTGGLRPSPMTGGEAVLSDISKQFAEDGFYHARGVFDAARVAALDAEFDRIVAQLKRGGEKVDATWPGDAAAQLAEAGDTIVHTHNVQRYSRAWLDALLDTRFLDPVRAILGPDVILHHSKLFQKPAENGSPFPMHQDWPYFPTVNDTMIAGVIHVSRATDEMGCLRVYPGSHRMGRIEAANGRSANAVLGSYPIERAQVVEAEPGDVVFFHYLTLHGSMPNRSDATRKTVLVQMYGGHDRVEAGNRHPDERMVLSGWNHAMSRKLAGLADA